MNIIRAWLPVAVYMAIIFVLSAQSYLPTPLIFGGHDKLEHFLIYLGLALLAFRGAVISPLMWRSGPYFQSLCLAALYGASDEYHQRFVPGRTADALDWLADVLGAAVGLVIVSIVRKRFTKGGR